MKKICLWLMTVCMLVCSIFGVACGGKKGNGDSATTQEYVTLSKTSLSIEVYSQEVLTATTNVDGAIVWTTSNASVATVEDGVISALSVGTATITATAGKASASCALTVTELSNFPELVLSETALELVEGGDAFTVTASAVYMEEELVCDFTWVSANEEIATVEDGKITPVAIGSTVITVTTECLGEILIKEIPVAVKPDEQVRLSKSEMQLALAEINAGDILVDTFSAQAYKKGEVNEEASLTFESSNAEVASVTVNSGEATVTAVGEGECLIKVYYESAMGRIESSVAVTVYRSKVVLDDLFEIEYVGVDTALDFASLDLAGDFEGVYFGSELVSDADGKLLSSFVDVNKASITFVEVRTNLAVYSMRIYIVTPFVTEVVQGDARTAMPTYEGDVTEIGFDEGTTVYTLENVTPNSVYDDGWGKRAIISAPTTQDYISIEFVAMKDITEDVFHVWGVNGAPSMVAVKVTTGEGAMITDMDGDMITAITAGTHYLVNIACEGLSEIQVGLISGDNTVYIANIAYKDGSYNNGNNVTQGDDRRPMTTYDGEATDLGFPTGTGKVYAIAASANDGWNNRIIIGVDSKYDYVKFDVISTVGLGFLTMWPSTGSETKGSYMVSGQGGTTTDGDPNREAFILDADGNRANTIEANKLYTVYFYLLDGETSVQCSSFTTATLYVANIECSSEPVNPDGSTDDPISQGEKRKPMPIYEGDVTALGFAAGTTVYQIVGPQSNASDVKLVAKVDPAGDNAYAKLDFVLSQATISLGLWITAENSHLGYYTITPTEFTTDGNGDPSRNIFVTDANGERITQFEANKVYTLYVGLDGREATVQLSTWADLTVYVANVACITEAEAPVEPTPPAQGKEISILFIGNSFSDDTEAYMVDILLSLGYTNINVGNLYIGGCSIDTHYQNIKNNTSAYDFRMRSHNGKKYTEYEPVSVDDKKQSIAFALAYKDWDIVSVQQASGESGKADTYNNLDALVAEVKKQAENAEIVFNMTWAYQSDSTHAQFPDYDSDQMKMYSAIVSAVQQKVSYTVIPNGTAIQNARTSLLGDTLTRDGYHLDLKIGRYIAGLTFVAKVTGVDISDIEYVPGGINELQFAIAIESVQNALAYPFTVTESEIEAEVVEDPDVTAGGSNATAVSVYRGDVTALGFAEGTTVYEYVGVDSAADKAAVKADPVNYDYVEFDFVITSGDGYFLAFVLKDGNFLNDGSSYVIDPSNLRLVNGNTMDRKIQVLEANGQPATALMSKNTLYKLRVFIKEGEVDQVMIGKNGSTIYLANVTQGLESELPIEGPIKQGDSQAALPNYNGDETAVGFEEGEYLQYMATETVGNVWGDKGPTSGKTREQLAAKILGETGKYVTVKFAVSQDIASGNVFYVWGMLNGVHTLNGAVNFTTTTHGRILDLDGNLVTSLSKNTVYVLELYMEGTNTYKVANICATGMELYFASNSITCSDTVVPAPAVNPTPIYSTDGNHTGESASVYAGDVTALGFAAGTKVYEQISNDGWNDRVIINVDSSYDYIDIQFSVSAADMVFTVWIDNAEGMIPGNYNVSNVGEATPLNGAVERKMQILDAEGNAITSAIQTGTVYTLRIYIDSLAKVELGSFSTPITLYYGDITFGNDE